MERCGSREKPCFQRVPLLMTVIGACVCLALFCSCAMAPIWFSHDSIPPKLPAAVSFNKGAGRGDPLYLTLRLESGEELLFMVDTGAAFTLLDKSLEPGLGKRYGTARIKWLGGKSTAVVYRAPKLYLGDTQLLTGARILTDDLRMIPLAGQPLQGILGTDCLRHYCIQLDFAARKIRFLDPDLPKSEDLGRAFPLSIFFSTVSAHENLVGVKGAKSDIDTGCNFDGTLSSGLFQQELRQQNLVLTNGMARLAESFWAGETYTNLNVVEYGGRRFHNLVGLRFLARHLVTFNFPKRTMYLQRQSVGPLANEPGSTNTLGSTSGWWETEGLPPSGNDKESLAARLVSAPNLRPGKPDAFSKVFSWDPPRFISVGPPSAKLRVVQMPYGDYRMKVASKVIPVADGEGKLWFEGLPENNRSPAAPVRNRGTLLLLHDYNYQKEHMVPWAWVLAQAGYNIILPDLRGHGDSSGETISYGKYETADLRQLLDYLTQQRACAEKVGVLGVGYGASLALHWAARDPRVGTVVAIAPYNQPEQAFARMARQNEASLSSEVLKEASALAAARLDIKWTDWSGETAMRHLKEPVLLIGGGKDAICSTNDLNALEQAAPAGSKRLLIPEADHKVIGYWFNEIEEPVKAWFREHMPAPTDGQLKKQKTASQ